MTSPYLIIIIKNSLGHINVVQFICRTDGECAEWMMNDEKQGYFSKAEHKSVILPDPVVGSAFSMWEAGMGGCV